MRTFHKDTGFPVVPVAACLRLIGKPRGNRRKINSRERNDALFLMMESLVMNQDQGQFAAWCGGPHNLPRDHGCCRLLWIMSTKANASSGQSARAGK